MKSILHEIYYGNINPNEKCYKNDSEYGETLKALIDNEEKLSELLNPDEKALLETVSETHNAIDGITSADSFVDGFCLGMRIAIEVMEKQI